MAYPFIEKQLDLESGEIWGASWGMSVEAWLALWSEVAPAPSISVDLARYETALQVGSVELAVRALWTFEEDRLLSIHLRPVAGGTELVSLLGALGIEREGLRDEGDGLARCTVGRTRVDVDRLDGYILLEEEDG